MRTFIDQHRHTHGVEPICKVLQISPFGYRRYGARRRDTARLSKRAQREATLVLHIERVRQGNLRVCGADEVWMQMRREGIAVVRCTVERLMRRLSLRGVIRGKVVRTTISDLKAACPLDRVNRQFRADRPNQFRVSDLRRCLDLAGLALRGLCHRRVRPANRRLESEQFDARGLA